MNAGGFGAVKAAACGRWPEILPALGLPAENLTSKQGPCPGCGGKDRFRFDDKGGSGSWWCNGGGDAQHGDGFDLLTHAMGLTKGEALRAVAGHLGIKSTASVAEIQTARDAQKVREIEEALVHEVLVLLQILQARVSARKLAADGRFRVARTEWQPVPDGHWERELIAVKRIKRGLQLVYGR